MAVTVPEGSFGEGRAYDLDPTVISLSPRGFRIQTLALPSGLKDRNDGYKTAIQVVAGPRFEPARLAAPRLLDPGPNSLFRRENSLIRQN